LDRGGGDLLHVACTNEIGKAVRCELEREVQETQTGVLRYVVDRTGAVELPHYGIGTSRHLDFEVWVSRILTYVRSRYGGTLFYSVGQ
jgi:hypothetical protein